MGSMFDKLITGEVEITDDGVIEALISNDRNMMRQSMRDMNEENLNNYLNPTRGGFRSRQTC